MTILFTKFTLVWGPFGPYALIVGAQEAWGLVLVCIDKGMMMMVIVIEGIDFDQNDEDLEVKDVLTTSTPLTPLYCSI